MHTGATIDLNFAFNGGLVDSSVSYEVPSYCSHIISCNAQGVVVPVGKGTAVVKVKEAATGKKIHHVVVKVLETAAYQAVSDAQTNTTPFTLQAFVVVPPSSSSSGSGSGGSGSGGNPVPTVQLFSPVVQNNGSDIRPNSFGNSYVQDSTGMKIFGSSTSGYEAWRMFDSDNNTIYTPSNSKTKDGWNFGGFSTGTARTLYRLEMKAAMLGGFPATTIRVEGSNNSQFGYDGDWVPLDDLTGIQWDHGSIITMLPSSTMKFKAFRIACPADQNLNLSKVEFYGAIAEIMPSSNWNYDYSYNGVNTLSNSTPGSALSGAVIVRKSANVQTTSGLLALVDGDSSTSMTIPGQYGVLDQTDFVLPAGVTKSLVRIEVDVADGAAAYGATMAVKGCLTRFGSTQVSLGSMALGGSPGTRTFEIYNPSAFQQFRLEFSGTSTATYAISAIRFYE